MVEEALQSAKIVYRTVASGEEALIRCEDLTAVVPGSTTSEQCVGSKEPKCYVNLSTGLYHCHRCRRSGAIGKPSTDGKSDSKPVQKPGRMDKAYIDALASTLWLPIGSDALAYLKGRGFTDDTIKAARLGYNPHTKAVSIPNFNINGEAVSLKYRYLNPDESGMRYGQEALNGQPQLPYGLAQLPSPRVGTLHILEGELEALSLKQLDPSAAAIGLPGMNAFPTDKRKDEHGLLAYFKDYDRIFLYPDNEIHAKLNFTKHATVLGRERCFIIDLPNKDLNDCLKAGATKKDLSEWQRTALKSDGPPYSFYIDDIKETVAALKTVSAISKRSTGFPTLDKYMAYIRPGELTILAGAGGGGKSTLAFQLAYNMLKQKTPVLLGSFEMDVRTAAIPRLLSLHHKTNLLLKAVNQGAGMDWASYMDVEPMKYLATLLPKATSVNVNSITAALDSIYEERNLARKEIVFMVVDHFHRIARPSAETKGSDTVTFYEQQIALIKDWTRKHPNLHVLLLCQFTKKGAAEKFTKDSLRGSVALQQESDSILIMNTKDDITTLTCDKIRSVAGNQGWGASITLQYDPQTTEVVEGQYENEGEY